MYTGFMNNQPLIMEAQGYETVHIPAFKYGYNFYSGVCFSTDAMIQKHPDLIRKFLDMSLRGWREAFKDLTATAQLVVEKYHPKGTVQQQAESLKVFKYLATMGVGIKLIGYMEEQYWQKGIDTLYKFQQIEKKSPQKTCSHWSF